MIKFSGPGTPYPYNLPPKARELERRRTCKSCGHSRIKHFNGKTICATVFRTRKGKVATCPCRSFR